MLPDRVSNPGPLTYESGALPIALRGPAISVCVCRWGEGGWGQGKTLLQNINGGGGRGLSTCLEKRASFFL